MGRVTFSGPVKSNKGFEFGSGASNSAGTSTGVLTLRTRVLIADINAGKTLLAAIAGIKYRLIDAYLVAYGGAVTSTNLTHVEIRGTQSASSAVLYKVAKAQLSQSTVNRIGTASTTILADGASFVACDANTAITINPLTGTDGATATGIDVVLMYAAEVS